MSKRKSHNPIWLESKGYDGLYSPEGPCGCDIGDLAPCIEGPQPKCVPARLGDDGLYYPAKRERRPSGGSR